MTLTTHDGNYQCYIISPTVLHLPDSSVMQNYPEVDLSQRCCVDKSHDRITIYVNYLLMLGLKTIDYILATSWDVITSQAQASSV